MPTPDFTTPEFRADPYPVYRRLRESDPVCWVPLAGRAEGMWLVTRYADVAAVLRGSEFSKDHSRMLPPERLTLLDRTMVAQDPPDHTRLRGLVSKAFTPQRVQELEPLAAELVASIVDGARERGRMDFVAELAVPLPVLLIATMLGVPREDRAALGGWTGEFMQSVDATRSAPDTGRRQQAALAALGDYFRGLVRERRRQPREDLVSAMVQAREADDRLSEDEVLGTCLLLLLAGHETTTHLLGSGLLTLLRNPHELALLRARPELLSPAVEEMMRYESPVQRTTFRVTTREVEIAGRRLQAGQQVSAVLGAANRDPGQFADPDRFHVARTPNRHLALGAGTHYCLGATLARLQARVALSILLARTEPRLVDDAPDWGASTSFRGLQSLRIEL
jgi:cytochrome P450